MFMKWEGLSLIEIYLQKKFDRFRLFKDAKNQLHSFIRNGVVELSLDSNRLIVKVEENFDFDETIKPILSDVLKKHVIKTREEKWLLDIICNMFYYEEPEEQLQILSMAKSILSGERQDIPNILNVYTAEKIVYESFQSFLTRKCNFCFDSFLTFRLKNYLDKLIDCVELAIDEYKLEQEYQNLVESFRYYIKQKQSKIEVVHLVFGDKILFFDQDHELINLEEYIEQDIVFEKEVPIDELIISPLVRISPKTIHLYYDETDNAVIQTIQNIFLERVKTHRKNSFYQLNSRNCQMRNF